MRPQSFLHETISLIIYLVNSHAALELAYLKVENRILRSKCSKYITITPAERYQILTAGLPLKGRIKHIINVVHYSTFQRWKNSFGKLSKKRRRGRPRITAEEVRSIILEMAKENLGWGLTRIRSELRRLFDLVPARNTVKAVLVEHNIPPAPERIDTWDNRIKRTYKTLWACDFFTKRIWTVLGPKLFYVLFFINIRTKKVRLAGTTNHPNNAWVMKAIERMRQLDHDKCKKLLIRDRDTKFTRQFDQAFERQGFEVKKTPYMSPNLNAYAESWVSVVKRECLSYFAIFGKDHLDYLLSEYIDYYNYCRSHSQLREGTPDLNSKIRKTKLLGGLIQHYYRE